MVIGIPTYAGHISWQHQSVVRVFPESRNAKRLVPAISEGMRVIYRDTRQSIYNLTNQVTRWAIAGLLSRDDPEHFLRAFAPGSMLMFWILDLIFGI